MSIQFFDPQLAVARVADQVPGLKLCIQTVDVPSAMEQLKQTPAAFVVPISESGGDQFLATGGTGERVVPLFSVLLAVSSLRDTSGAAAAAELVVLRQAVATALLGWTPDSAIYDPFEFASGRLVVMSDRVAWWQDNYRTAHYLET